MLFSTLTAEFSILYKEMRVANGGNKKTKKKIVPRRCIKKRRNYPTIKQRTESSRENIMLLNKFSAIFSFLYLDCVRPCGIWNDDVADDECCCNRNTTVNIVFGCFCCAATSAVSAFTGFLWQYLCVHLRMTVNGNRRRGLAGSQFRIQRPANKSKSSGSSKEQTHVPTVSSPPKHVLFFILFAFECGMSYRHKHTHTCYQ